MMGDASLETAMGYFHAENLSVRSPLQMILAGDQKIVSSPLEK